MITVALLGAGRIGRVHAANVAAHAQASLASVVDVDEAAATALAAEHGARAASAEQAVAACDAAIIAAPTDSHEALITLCARAGVPILCEKPLDLDVARARASLDTAASAGVALHLGFNRRFDPSFQRLRDALAGGVIGRLESLAIISRDPSPPPLDYVRRSGGLFRDMTIHDFDMARWLLDEDPIEVYATGGCLIDPDIGAAGDIDTAVVVLRTESGALCQITNSRRASYGYDQRIEAFGAGGMVSAGNPRATEVERADAAGFLREPALPFFLERYAEAYRRELDAFLTPGTSHLASGADGLKALLLAEAAERSHLEGRPVSPAYGM